MAPMRLFASALETVHLAALGVWVGAVGMTAAVAAIIFPQMNELDPDLPGFASYPSEHGVIAAGWVMARVFMILDWVQLAAAGLAFLTLLVRVVVRGAAPMRWTAARLALTVASAGLLLWYLLAVAQPMNADLVGFWQAAQAGDVERADALRASFDERHPTASRALGSLMLAALATLIVGGLAATRPADRPAVRSEA
jgi:hypothetical protein